MKKNIKPKSNVIEELYNNKLLCSKVNTMLDDPDYTYDDIVEFCGDKDFDISKSSLSRYNTRRKEALDTGQDLGDLVRDGREKNGSVVDIRGNRVDELSTSGYTDSEKKVTNVVDMLDEVIQKGYQGLQYVETVPMADAFKAAELKHKFTDGRDEGFSSIGLSQILTDFNIRTDTMLEVMAEYIPQEKHEEIFELIDQRIDEMYANSDLTKDQEELNKYIEKMLG